MYMPHHEVKSGDENHDEMDITTLQLMMSHVHAMQECSFLGSMISSLLCGMIGLISVPVKPVQPKLMVVPVFI